MSEDIVEQNNFLSTVNIPSLELINKQSDNSLFGESTKNSSECTETKSSCSKKKKNPLLDYVELDMIGCGAFGRVVKVQKKKKGEQYAMKVIEKMKVEKVHKPLIFNTYIILQTILFWCYLLTAYRRIKFTKFTMRETFLKSYHTVGL